MTVTATEFSARVAKAMSEAELTENVRDACAKLGLLRYHTHISKHSPAGFPDEVIVGPHGMLYRELKREGKDPTDAQDDWLYGLGRLGCDVDVWRPRDWLSGRIARELRAISARR